VTWENAKELRDFYRGGVQQKAQAERKIQEKDYAAALKSYDSSNDFFSKLLEYLDEDSADYQLFEGTSVLFFPNLLLADNYLKMGRIHDALGRKRPAFRHWKRGLSWVKRSLKCERTEWGLAVQDELSSVLTPKKD
jgi:tetratricopeptide (TPR) repeat protein